VNIATIPAWSILIATCPARATALAGLLDALRPQAERAWPRVEIVAYRNPGGLDLTALGHVRQALLHDARGEFVSFIDDDDMTEPDFVPLVLDAIDSSPPPDYIAFGHRFTDTTIPGQWGRVSTGLMFDGWYDTVKGYVRDITHVNPVRASIARGCGGFAPGTGPEDQRYAAGLRAALKGHRDAAIPRQLYHYRRNQANSVQFGTIPESVPGPLPQPPGPWFRWHPDST